MYTLQQTLSMRQQPISTFPELFCNISIYHFFEELITILLDALDIHNKFLQTLID